MINFVKIIIIFFSFLDHLQLQAQNTVIKENNTHKIKLETFSSFPNEIDGCSCYFSISQEDLKGKMYIFVNDFASLAFVKIAGKLIQFELQEHDEKHNIYYYIHDDYKMKVEIIKKTAIADELVVVDGIITIDSKKGQAKQKFIGECGC